MSSREKQESLDELIRTVLELNAKATKGPWEYTPHDDFDDWTLYNPETTEFIKHDDAGVPIGKEDGALIAHYRTAAPILARELRKAQDEIKCLKFNLEQTSQEIGRSEHRGNTVDYIYDKLENYSKQLLDCGYKCRELEAENAHLSEELKEAYGACIKPLEKENAEFRAAYGKLMADISEMCAKAEGCSTRRNELEADNARLRKALAYYAKDCKEGCNPCDHLMARAALEGK